MGKFTDTGDIIYNIGAYRFGWTTATFVKSSDACCKYILKYVTKELINVTKNKKRYWASKNVERPVIEDEIILPEDFEFVKENLFNESKYQKSVDYMLYGEARRLNVFEFSDD